MFEEYLEELTKVKILSREKEKELWKKYKEHNDLSARADLIEAYQPFVFKLVMKMQSKSDIILDLIQEATIGLIEAVERYDYLKGINFATYASFRIRGQIINYLQKFNMEAISLDQVVPSDEEEGATLLELVPAESEDELLFMDEMFWHEPIKEAVSRLSPKERKIIEGIFFEGKRPERLAKELNMSLAHVYRLQKKAIRRVRGMLSKLKHQYLKD